MTIPSNEGQRATILSEISQVTFPEPGVPVDMVAITYQIGNRPPRTVFVPAVELADVIFAQNNPEGPPPSDELIRSGDAARRARIKVDIERRSQVPQQRTLDL